ncbi:MAG: hypothetical protein IPL86_11940 [Flavobacteriales bacterium]|nr:hypothetical protein [Flavobacteriales bacterium]
MNDVGAALRTNVPWRATEAGVELMFAAQISTANVEGQCHFQHEQVRNYTEYVDDWDKGGPK